MNASRIPALLPILLLACPSKETGDSTASDPCTAVLEETVPVSGATGVYHRAPVEFVLSADDESASIAVTDAAGAEVAGSVTFNADGTRVSFTADPPLLPQATYSATLTWCGGTETVAFETSDYGVPRTASPAGNTYVVTLKDARFVEPEALSGILPNALKLDVLLEVAAVTDGVSVDILGAVAVEGSDPPVQDFCGATMDFSGADLSGDPFFHLGPMDVTFNLPTHDMVVDGLQISGTFKADGTDFGGGVLESAIDVRKNIDMYKLLGLAVETGDDVVAALSSMGVETAACADGQLYCMILKAVDITAPVLGGVDLEVVPTDHCHAACANNDPECDL